MKTSDSIKEIAKALSAAQGELKNPEKNRTVKITPRDKPSYSYNFAELAPALDLTRPILSKNGLSHCATIGLEPTPHLTMRLMHLSGEWVESEYPLPRSSTDKELASAISFGKRYLFFALIGIVGDEDLDSEEARSGEHSQRVSHSPIAPVVPKFFPGEKSYYPPEAYTPIESENPAPPSDLLPPLEVKPPQPAKLLNPGSFIIPFGKFAGNTLEYQGIVSARNDLQYWQTRIDSDGKPATGKVKAYMDALSDFIASKEVGAEDDIPF